MKYMCVYICICVWRGREYVSNQVHLVSLYPLRCCKIEHVGDIGMRDGSARAFNQLLQVRLRAEMVQQNLGGKKKQMQISLSVKRESHTFKSKVQPSIFVVKFSISNSIS